jgi:carbamoyltransferase
MPVILGINAYHGDSSACLVIDGQLIAAAEEERFRRIKHWAGFPEQAIRYCLEEVGVSLSDVHHVAVNSDPAAQRWARIAYALRRRPSPALVWQRLRNRARKRSVRDDLERRFPRTPFRGQVHEVEHHQAHLASCFLMSPFERAVTVSVDGFGDFCSAAWGVGEGAALALHQRVLFPHSLGIFYQALTQYLGFDKYGDEYKVMGLAAYGRPVFVEPLRRLVRGLPDGRFELDLRFFRHARERIDYQWDECEPQIGTLFSPALVELLGPARQSSDAVELRHQNLAASVQALYEEAFFNLLNAAHRAYGGDAVCLAGGCAMNSLANGRLTLRTPFKRVYVQAAAGDAGGAIGAAAQISSTLLRRRPAAMEHAYWGPGFDRTALAAIVSEYAAPLREAGCRSEWLDEAGLCRRTAEHVADGKVVGWFQGRMEWGPRALGNRSIVCDPRRADMKGILNLKIKRRESFRPFAPSILREHVAEWFEQDGDVPFMMQVYGIRPEKRALIPAVTHVDGSGRLQTVSAEQNPRYYRLIGEFHKLAGVPMVLNTSFNENEPVVCRPQEALDCFLRTRMDVLVLGECLIERV